MAFCVNDWDATGDDDDSEDCDEDGVVAAVDVVAVVDVVTVVAAVAPVLLLLFALCSCWKIEARKIIKSVLIKQTVQYYSQLSLSAPPLGPDIDVHL